MRLLNYAQIPLVEPGHCIGVGRSKRIAFDSCYNDKAQTEIRQQVGVGIDAKGRGVGAEGKGCNAIL